MLKSEVYITTQISVFLPSVKYYKDTDWHETFYLIASKHFFYLFHLIISGSYTNLVTTCKWFMKT